jgi:2-amino-4-hydroxy-6-hydroxymethyldihydropteridine diphosphokinase
MVSAWIGMGANVGDRLGAFRAALAELESLEASTVVRVSSVYDTAPWGVTDQERFLNAVVQLRTGLPAATLLAELAAIEARCGRVRHERWGPRTLDLDILLYGDEIIATADLTVPHPRLSQRAFVLVPLAELEPSLEVPGLGVTVATLLDQLGADALDVERVGPPPRMAGGGEREPAADLDEDEELL